MIITMRDVRAAKMCSGGARRWAARHGVDWLDFVQNGIEAERILETGCPIGKRLVETARVERK